MKNSLFFLVIFFVADCNAFLLDIKTTRQSTPSYLTDRLVSEDYFAKDDRDNTILHVAATMSERCKYLIKYFPHELDELMRKGGSSFVNAKNNLDSTALFNAITHDNELFAALLISYGANPYTLIITRKPDILLPQHVVAIYKQEKILNLFLSKFRMDPNELSLIKQASVIKKGNLTPLRAILDSMNAYNHENVSNWEKINFQDSYVPTIVSLLNFGAIVRKEDMDIVNQLSHRRIASLFKNHVMINAWLSKNFPYNNLQKSTNFARSKSKLSPDRIVSRCPLPQEIIKAKMNASHWKPL